MKNDDIAKLRSYCEDFKKYQDSTVDGNGGTLDDIKNTFVYVGRSLDEYSISGTTFGSNLSAKAKETAAILDQLKLVYQNLVSSVEGFCDNQERNNNRS